MSNDDGTDLAAAVVSEVVKQLPIRQALEPAATELGKLGADLIKCVRLALVPFQFGAMLQDRVVQFIKRAVDPVPTVQRIQPAPQILGPILEGIRYETEGSISDQAFCELLTRAFDRERVNQAHPAFPAIIRALADDEMILLRRVVEGHILIKAATQFRGEDTYVTPDVDRPEFAYLHFPKQVVAYATHLEALGLVLGLVAEYPSDYVPNEESVDLNYVLRLSEFGVLFAKAIFSPL